MSLGWVLTTLKRGWKFLATGLVLGALLALGMSLLQDEEYSVSTQFFVSTTSTTDLTEAQQGSELSQQRALSYVRLLEGRDFASILVDRLRLSADPESLSDRIEASAVPDTVLIDVAVRADSPRRALDVAEAIGAEFPDYVAGLEAPGDGGLATVQVRVTEQPVEPISPSSPKLTLNSLAGASLGLLSVGLVLLARRRLDRSVKEPDDVARLTGTPVIGTVLQDAALHHNHTIDRAPTSRTAEDYRQLRTNLQFLNIDEPPKVIMVSSALPSEGKTTAVVNLGLALADAGRQVTIIEADLRKPKVTRYLGLVGGAGLTNVLSGSAELADVMQNYGNAGLRVLGAGPTPPNPGELLSSHHMFSLLDKLRGENDFVLLDTPPLLPVADSTGLAVYMDGVLLSVRYGSTHRDQLQQAAVTLERVGAKVLGVILNIVPPKAELATAYGYGQSYGYQTPPEAPTG